MEPINLEQYDLADLFDLVDEVSDDDDDETPISPGQQAKIDADIAELFGDLMGD